MKHNFDFLSIGDKISIVRLDFNTSFSSQVLEIITPDEMVIGGPIRKSNYILIHKNETIQVSYHVEDRGKYSFRANVISSNLSNIYTLKIRKISDTYIVQEREYYRLPVTLEVEKLFEVTKENEVQVLEEYCEAKNLSGGGIKLFCSYKHKIGDKVVCRFDINGSLIKVNGSVVRVEEIDSFFFQYSIGISFIDISEVDRDLIIGFIFEQQRILRGKGLI